MWLSQLKTALVLEEISQIAELIDTMPPFTSVGEMEEASYLLQQAQELMVRNREETAQTLKQLKNTLDFLKSTQSRPAGSLNIKL